MTPLVTTRTGPRPASTPEVCIEIRDAEGGLVRRLDSGKAADIVRLGFGEWRRASNGRSFVALFESTPHGRRAGNVFSSSTIVSEKPGRIHGALMNSADNQGTARPNPATKSALSESQRHLVELMQRLNFGRIEGLRVCGGEPVFDPAPRVVRKLKIGGENGPRTETAREDFLLKQQTLEMLEAIAQLGEGEVRAIEVKHGLAFAMEMEHSLDHNGGCRD